jgi:hypothetical protein
VGAHQAKAKEISLMSKQELVSAYHKVFVDIWYDQSMYYADKKALVEQIAVRLRKLEQKEEQTV